MEQDYHKREIDLMFSDIKEALTRIEGQTIKHNGRLTKLERMMWTCTGAILILGWLYTNNFINCLGKVCQSISASHPVAELVK